MKKIIVLCVLFVFSQASIIPNLKLDENLNEEWELFKNTFNKKYENMIAETSRRLIWEQNIDTIQKHNLDYDMGLKKFRMGVNQFSDMTHEEFKGHYLGYKQTLNKTKRDSTYTFRAPLNFNLPDQVDWRTKGYVTPVKNQAQCGSCWAFSTTGSLEGQHFRATGNLLSFSEQQLVDCSGNYGNMGCNGGLMDNAFKYIKQYGIESEQSYPYEAKDDNCSYKKSKVVGTCKGFVDVKHQDEQDLQKAVATVGPVSVAIDASHYSFQAYSGGIYDEPDCVPTALDHGVLVVGYGEDNGQKYWLVKNSWGANWGMNGYIKMSRDKDNQCGIATMASYPLV